jgi:hypothetical protein
MARDELTTSRHLVQSLRYQSPDGRWRVNFGDALTACGKGLTWNPAALLSISQLTYPCGDRTIFNEIVRQPWLSSVPESGAALQEEIPPHELRWVEPQRIADELYSRLDAELRSVCKDRRHIYLLLSGGLDSRIVAGAISQLHRRGDLACTPVAVTWGLEDSVDVAYAREVAKRLGFEWIHVSLAPEHLLENIEATATFLGANVPPNYLHRVLWFRKAETDALVLAGSYGDMVGRGEFSGRTVLELTRHRPNNAFGLLKPEIALEGGRQFNADVESLRKRQPGQFEYVYCEREQHCFYTRGSLAQALGVIGRFCHVYQVFTDPAVYSYMWSLHPALRTDEPYARLLQRYDPYLVQIPWARTNRALAGAASGVRRRLRRAYHDYAGWTRGVLYSRLRDLVDPDWFERTGTFDGQAVARLGDCLRTGTLPQGTLGNSVAWAYLWLATLRRTADLAAEDGLKVSPPSLCTDTAESANPFTVAQRPGRVRSLIRSQPALRRWFKQMNVRRLRRASVELYPPNYS